MSEPDGSDATPYEPPARPEPEPDHQMIGWIDKGGTPGDGPEATR